MTYKATNNCDHNRIKIELKQIIYSEIRDGEISQGEPRDISYVVNCPDCGLYQIGTKPPKWVYAIINKAIKGES